MEKLQVTQDLYKVLKELTSRDMESYSYDYILEKQAAKGWGDDWWILNTLSVSEMAHALYVGFETKMTKEEKILTFFNSFDYTPQGEAEERSVIREVLNLAEIKIDGIN